MNKPIPEGGRSVKCARCGHQWRLLPDEPEELSEALEVEADPASAAAPGAARPAMAGPETAEAAARFEAAPPAAPGEPPNWDARRGHLAAAIASMGEDEAQAGHRDTEPGQHGYDEGAAWAAGQAERSAAEEPTGPTVGEVFFGMSPDAVKAQPEVEPEPDERAPWMSVPPWLRNERGEEPAPQEPADGVDPEMSVREALRAALLDPELQSPEPDAREETHDASDTPAIAQSVFADTDFNEEAAAPAPHAMASGYSEAVDTDEDLRAAGEDEDFLAEKNGFISRWKSFAGNRAAPPPENETPEPALGADAREETVTVKFEDDIAGIFRQETQGKRGFGPAPGTRPQGEGDFTDYDMDAGSGANAADDRYMADSPLDADAAALQAALEGSLRERHAEDSRSGGGLALAAAWAVFLSVLTGVMLAFVNFRDEIVVALPGMGGLYRSVGLGVQEQQVDFGPVSYRWIEADGKPVIQVTGEIINLTDREITLPRLLINIHDRGNGETIKATETLRSEPLAAHETTSFTLEFMSPSKTIGQIELAFADTE